MSLKQHVMQSQEKHEHVKVLHRNLLQLLFVTRLCVLFLKKQLRGVIKMF